ncbi:hypothetical protein M758_4G135100 [Ceratodon purpureus]|nr:hypothetical protein M758_4G135100 [Ceratodon purpureus]KAG0619374.1 hypothetical protein M758_4G135100 [Ceratodon purpureus]
MSILESEVGEQSQTRTMDPHHDVKPFSNELRLSGERRRRSLSPEFDNRRRKYDVDVGLLQCIICENELLPPVCQCKNGHMACQACCKTRTRGQCPKCFQPIGRTRNKAVEQMIASLKSPCKHAVNGCKKMLASSNRKQHELFECEFMMLYCPFECGFSGFIRNFSSHVEHKHKDARIIRHNESEQLLTFGGFNLDPRDEYVFLKSCPELFLLHQEDTALGKMLYVTSCGKETPYSLEVLITSDYEKGRTKSFKMETMTSINGRTPGLRDFLLVPKQITCPHYPPVSTRCTVRIPMD